MAVAPEGLVCENSFLHRKLVLLECPLLLTGGAGWPLVLDEDTKFQQLVVWLEETKLRFYTQLERKALRDIRSQSWWRTFYTYCADLGVVFCNGDDGKIPANAHRRLLAADRLSSLALQDHYVDKTCANNNNSTNTSNRKQTLLVRTLSTTVRTLTISRH
eukprot:GHVS01104856.1.p1 GENE.GHVS01104856.1~~GHVS01104856.1.p1  ORF type:complete len:160 (-),score=28.84 GHVS01104856.1:670-1149(-)